MCLPTSVYGSPALIRLRSNGAAQRLAGRQLIICLLIFAASTSSAHICWPSVRLRNLTDIRSGGTYVHKGTAALWIRGLPCSLDVPCCSAKIVVGQGQHEGLPHSAKPGLERITQGHDVAFLAGMPWNATKMRTVLLASCASSMEAATLSIALPSSKLFCLQPVSGHSQAASVTNTDQEQGTKSFSTDWSEVTMLIKIHHRQLRSAVQTTGADIWEPLRIDLEHAWPDSVPKAFDVVVIPAEGRDFLLSISHALLQSSQLVVSEGVMERSRIWNTSTPQRQEPSSPYVHMHRSGWEVYAKQLLDLDSKEPVTAASVGGQVKVALHITAIAHYQLSLQQHFDRLIFSGLYDLAQGIYCFILGPDDAEITAAATFVRKFGHKVVVAGTSVKMDSYERFTLLGIRDHLQPEDVFLYMHTKGLSHAAADLREYDWVFYMHYFVVKHYQVCLSLIKEQFEVCGVEYHFPDPEKPWIPSEHYSGNFWWAHASYFLSLPDSIGSEYVDPEMYIGLGKPRYAGLWESNTMLWAREYPPVEFVDIAPKALGLPGRHYQML